MNSITPVLQKLGPFIHLRVCVCVCRLVGSQKAVGKAKLQLCIPRFSCNSFQILDAYLNVLSSGDKLAHASAYFTGKGKGEMRVSNPVNSDIL